MTQSISEINPTSSQTTYKDTNLMNGSNGEKSFQAGANAGQSISADLCPTANVSAIKLGCCVPQKGTAVGSIDGLSLDDTCKYVATAADSPAAITTVDIFADDEDGYSYTDQNNKALGDSTGTQDIPASDSNDGTAKYTRVAANVTTTNITAGKNLSVPVAMAQAHAVAAQVSPPAVAAVPEGTVSSQRTTELDSFEANSTPQQVSAIDISTASGAASAIEWIGNALNSVNALQPELGAVQDRCSSVATTQQAQSTDLSSGQWPITDADLAQETANLNKARVLQQAGISVLAQANSLLQQVMMLLG